MRSTLRHPAGLLDPTRRVRPRWYTLTTPETCTVHGHQCRVTFDTRTGPSRNLAESARHRRARVQVPRELVEVRHRDARQSPRRLCARHLRRAPGVPRDRSEHGGRLRHDLRRPQRQLPVRRREAGHQGVAALLARHRTATATSTCLAGWRTTSPMAGPHTGAGRPRCSASPVPETPGRSRLDR